MTSRSVTRIVLLIPVLGFLFAALFSPLPGSGASVQTPGFSTAFSVPDHEINSPQAYTQQTAPEKEFDHAHKFFRRGRAIPPVPALNGPVFISLRESLHIGRYVLRHAEVREEVPASSQYAYLFRLTPF